MGGTGPVTIVFDTMGNDLKLNIGTPRQNSNILNPQHHATNFSNGNDFEDSDSVVFLYEIKNNVNKKVKIEIESDNDKYKTILAKFRKNPKSKQNSNILNETPSPKQYMTNHNKNEPERQ